MVLLLAAALLLAWANGSNDNFKATATLYGSGTVSFRGALGIATVAQIAGSLASVFLAGTLLHAFGGHGLVPDEVVAHRAFLVSVGAGAALSILLASRVGLPASTTHSLIGALIGAGLVLNGGQIDWGPMGSDVLIPLSVSPLIALAAAGALYPVARAARKAMGLQAWTLIDVGQGMQQVDTLADGSLALRDGRSLTDAEAERCERRYQGSLLGVPAQLVVDRAHAVSAFALGFARGLNDTPKVLALLVAAGWSGLDPRFSLVVVAGAMALGGIIYSRRVAETLAHRITSMNRGQGLAANLVSSMLVIGASLMGAPVSTTHVSTGAIFGIGLHTGSADWRIVTGIVVSWVLLIPLAGVLAAGFAIAL